MSPRPSQPTQELHHPLNKPRPRLLIFNLMPRPRNKPRKLTHHPLPTSLDPPPHQRHPIHRRRHQLILPGRQDQQRLTHPSKGLRELRVSQIRREKVFASPAKPPSVSATIPKRTGGGGGDSPPSSQRLPAIRRHGNIRKDKRHHRTRHRLVFLAVGDHVARVKEALVEGVRGHDEGGELAVRDGGGEDVGVYYGGAGR